jgi:5-methylcytosine-specific restriction endonuclease McrA
MTLEEKRDYKKLWFRAHPLSEAQKQRNSQRRRERRAKNAEKYKSLRKQAYQKNRKRERALNVEYQKTHREQIKPRRRKNYLLRREHELREGYHYRKQRPDQMRELYKRYREKHWQKYRAFANNRRKREIWDGGVTSETVQRVYEANVVKHGQLTCYLCSHPIVFGDDTLEHKVPLFRGGGNDFGNLDIAHKSCNSSKSTKTEAEYREWLKCLT